MDNSLLSSIDQRGVAYLTLNRPEKRNAFDADLIVELTHALKSLASNAAVRVVVLTGKGESFSSGADLNWMQSMVAYDEQTNQQDSKQLADLMYELYNLNIPTIAKVNGNAFGGALGLITCCDIAIAVDHAKYSFSEVKLGIIPAVISPYIIAAIGSHATKRLFLTGEFISADSALRIGLVHELVTDQSIDSETEKQVHLLLKGSPVAQKEIKQLIHSHADINNATGNTTSKLIAKLRTSKEGQEGLKAFIEKRAPHWVKPNDYQ